MPDAGGPDPDGAGTGPGGSGSGGSGPGDTGSDAGAPGVTGLDEPVLCSARGCRSAAVHALRWNNPRLHSPTREKTWTACDDHRESLAAFLSARGFLRRIEPLN